MRSSLLILTAALWVAALTLVPPAQAAGPSPGLVWVDANGAVVGTPLGATTLVIQTSYGLVFSGIDEVDERYDRIFGSDLFFFATTDCSGTAYRPPSGGSHPINAGDEQLILDAAGHLYLYDLSQSLTETPELLSYRNSQNECTAHGGTKQGRVMTLLEADFLSQFTAPFHLQLGGSFASLPTGPWWLTVALLGTGFGLQWRYYRRKEAL